MKTLEIQTLLAALGIDPGPLDGIPGPRTRSGIKRFQSEYDLPITGIADAPTIRMLIKAAGQPDAVRDTVSLPWLDAAYALKGTREIPGPRSNPVIMGWARGLGGWIEGFFTNDDIAWCGLFTAHCFSSTLPSEPLPSNPLGAQQWSKFGRSLDTPALGAVLVFWRGSPSSAQGHVGFYVGEDAHAYHVLGGNQSNAVTITRIAKNRLLKNGRGIRWPSSVPLPKTGRVNRAATGSLSTNEA